jgi:hypothetical protein
MGKPVPEVDAQLAAQNEAKLIPSEGFSPLKPLISFAQALGFKGPPDRYEQAQRTLAAMKAEAQADTAVADGVRAGDELLIQATLEKDASGRTKETAVVGSNPKGTQPPTDKKDDKKKDSKKETKKPKKKPF